MELDFAIVGAIAGLVVIIANPSTIPPNQAIASPALDPTKTLLASNRAVSTPNYSSLKPGECNCTEYVARRVGIPDTNEMPGETKENLKSLGFTQTAYPQPDGIALLDANIPGVTQPDSGHIAYIESVDEGVPVITDSNSGGNNSALGCNNVQTSRREEYFAPGVSFWSKR